MQQDQRPRGISDWTLFHPLHTTGRQAARADRRGRNLRRERTGRRTTSALEPCVGSQPVPGCALASLPTASCHRWSSESARRERQVPSPTLGDHPAGARCCNLRCARCGCARCWACAVDGGLEPPLAARAFDQFGPGRPGDTRSGRPPTCCRSRRVCPPPAQLPSSPPESPRPAGAGARRSGPPSA